MKIKCSLFCLLFVHTFKALLSLKESLETFCYHTL